MAKTRRTKVLVQNFVAKTKESFKQLALVASSTIDKKISEVRSSQSETSSGWRKESRLKPYEDYSEDIPVVRRGCPVRVNGDGRRAVIEGYGFN